MPKTTAKKSTAKKAATKKTTTRKTAAKTTASRTTKKVATKKMTAPKKTMTMNNEACNTCRGGDSFKLVVVILLVANFIANILILNNFQKNTINALQQFEAEKVGGTEVYEIRQDVYSHPTFKELGKNQADSMLQRLEGEAGQQPNNPNAQQPNAVKKISQEQIKQAVDGVYLEGKGNAGYALLEYSDFLCPFCQRQNKDGTVAQMLEEYPNDIKAAFVPNTRWNPTSLKISVAAECAGEQGKFNEYVNAMFNAGASVAQIEPVAAELGLNTTTFKSCVDTDKYADKVTKKMQEWSSFFGVRWTPGNVILNLETGEYILIAGAYPVSEFKARFEELMAKDKE